MKKLVLGLTATAVLTFGIFTFMGCEKEEISQTELTKQTTGQNICLATVAADYDISYLVTIPEFDRFAHHFSNMLGSFSYNIESNDTFNTQIINLCQNIMESSDPDVISSNYSEMVQMIFPTEYLNVVTNNNGQISFTINTDSLNETYQNLIVSINNIYPGFYDIPEEIKQQILAKMIEKRFFEGNSINGPLEKERDEKIASALLAYTFEMATCIGLPELTPIIFSLATLHLCLQIDLAWKEYYQKGGKEKKKLCKICES